MTNVLVFSAHPDDAELVVGGVITSISKKHHVSMVYLTDGETTNSVNERVLESANACAELSVSEKMYCGFENGNISEQTVTQQKKLIEIIRLLKPQVILSPHYSDSHVDHKEAYRLIKRSRYIAGTSLYPELGSSYGCKYIYFYAQNPCLDMGSIFFDVSDVYSSKLKAIKCYKSQFGCGSQTTYVNKVLLEKTFAKDRYHGSIFGVDYAEELMYEGKLMISSIFNCINAGL